MGFEIQGLDKFKRDLAKLGKAQAEKAFKQHVAETQRILDDVHRTSSGKEVAEVKRVLRSRLTGGQSYSDEHIEMFAEAIAGGSSVKLDPKMIR